MVAFLLQLQATESNTANVSRGATESGGSAAFESVYPFLQFVRSRLMMAFCPYIPYACTSRAPGRPGRGWLEVWNARRLRAVRARLASLWWLPGVFDT